ncbi:hypothetical protein HDU98_007503 [Podochytrium sp. JEL0797]|nr:hypothetical protein HDU98_007503 [Podochytrium sp. JEL0797]
MTKIDIVNSAGKAGTHGLNAGRSLLNDFKAFISRGSLIDLAVGIILGGAFNTIVQSFVTDIISPVISLIGQKNLENVFLIIKCNSSSPICQTGASAIYPTIAAAAADGAITWNYGRFFQDIIYFFIVAVVMFFVVKAYATFLANEKKAVEEVVELKQCVFCKEKIHAESIKCKFCASSV